jgi:hypothetical protein
MVDELTAQTHAGRADTAARTACDATSLKSAVIMRDLTASERGGDAGRLERALPGFPDV